MTDASVDDAEVDRKRAAWRHRVESTAFAQLCGMRFAVWSPGEVVLEVPYSDSLSAYAGTFHGGLLATAIDTAAFGAVMAGHDFGRGDRYFTASLSLNYLGTNQGEDLRVSARCTRRGAGVCFVHATASTPSGRALAEGIVTLSAVAGRSV